MEGRIRVSVVATGIDADEMRNLPENIERLRPRAVASISSKPGAAIASAPVPSVAAITRASVNPVHRQVEALAEELNMPAPAMTGHASVMAEDQIVFEDSEMPDPESMPEVAVIRTAPKSVSRSEPARTQPAQQYQQQKKQSFFGLFGRQKPKVDLRQEPAPTPVAQPRATAQVITRIQPEPAARSTPMAMSTADDLFPELKKDEQFEIPAFLRRQTN